MTYTLYIAENCHQCADVLNFMTESKFDFSCINVDVEDKKPPIALFAYPALFKDNTLLCYGTDIITYLSEQSPKI